MSSKKLTEECLQDFIKSEGGINLKELVFELLNNDRWDDEIHYMSDTVRALFAFLVNPKINKKFHQENPRLDIVTGPHMARLVLFFEQLKKFKVARAELMLEYVQQSGSSMSDKEMELITTEYSINKLPK
jgi:hypothetical protein